MKNTKEVMAAVTKWLSRPDNRKIKNSVALCNTEQFLNSLKMGFTRVNTLEKPNSYDVKQVLKYPIGITGSTGVGKSWLAGQISGHFPKRKIVHLDEYSHDASGVNTLKVDDVPLDADFYEGNANGTYDFMYDKCKTVVVPIVTFDHFRQICAAKAKDGKEMGLPANWIRYWSDRSVISDARVGREMFKSITLTLSHLAPEQDLYVVENTPKDEIRKGWWS